MDREKVDEKDKPEEPNRVSVKPLYLSLNLGSVTCGLKRFPMLLARRLGRILSLLKILFFLITSFIFHKTFIYLEPLLLLLLHLLFSLL